MRLTLGTNLLALLSATAIAKGTPTTPTETSVDVIIVGGGYSGLMSAYDLQRAGFTTLVLEAKDKIGGRSRSITRQSGPGIIELGATWINNTTQPAVYALTQEFGLDTAEQYTDGDSVFQDLDGTVRRLEPGTIVNTDDLIAAELEGKLTQLIIETAEQQNIHKFDGFPIEQDVSVADWVDQQGLWWHPYIKATTARLTTSLVGRQPEEIGAHYLFDYIKSGSGLINLSDEGEFGAQSLKIKQGTTAIATSLADAMSPGSVLVNTPVDSITQVNGTSSIIVTAKTGQTFKAKKLILAIPTNTYGDIKFSPPLPCKKNTLIFKTKPGVYAKLILSYAEPWWRNAGLVGKFASLVGPVCFSWDTSDISLEQYSLAIFVAGDIASRWHELTDSERTSSIIEHLSSLVDEELADKARDTIEINYVEWTKEEYLWGAPTSVMGPGMLRKYGKTLREPFGNLYFGGGETAYEWKGYLEGAIRAGSRAAEEVIEVLGN